jgi:hypothetical protein
MFLQLTEKERTIFELACPHLQVMSNELHTKEADKLSRFSKDFSKIWPKWGDGSVAENLYAELADGVENWFFLWESKKIARIELDHRINEHHAQNALIP